MPTINYNLGDGGEGKSCQGQDLERKLFFFLKFVYCCK